MGVIERGDEQVVLGSRVCVGRSPECVLAITDRRVSGRHAELVWTRAGWQVRDLGSTNGTTLDGKRFDAGKDYALARGSVLAFGDPELQWRLVDASAPDAMATSTSGLRRAAENRLLALPDDDQLEAVIFESEPGVWVAEVDGVPSTVRDQEFLTEAIQSSDNHEDPPGPTLAGCFMFPTRGRRRIWRLLAWRPQLPQLLRLLDAW